MSTWSALSTAPTVQTQAGESGVYFVRRHHRQFDVVRTGPRGPEVLESYHWGHAPVGRIRFESSYAAFVVAEKRVKLLNGSPNPEEAQRDRIMVAMIRGAR